MEEWPERYKRLALLWLDEQWNKPSRSDYYLMRVAQRVHQWSTSKTSIKDQLIQFTTAKALTPEERVAQSKAVWMGGLEAYRQNEALRAQQGIKQWPQSTR